MKKYLSYAALALMSSSVFSNPFWSFDLKVKHVTSHADGSVQAMFHNNDSTVHKACGELQWYSFNMTAPGSSAMHSSLLTALMSKKKVGIIFYCTDNSILAVKLNE